MKRFAVEPGSGPSNRRRWLVRAVAAIPAMLMLSAFPRVARAQQRDTLQGHFDPIDEADLIDLLLGFDLVQEQLSASTIEKTRQLGGRLATGCLGNTWRAITKTDILLATTGVTEFREAPVLHCLHKIRIAQAIH